MAGNYKLSGNITASTGVSGTFTGTFDGGMYTITGLTEPLFETVNGATICNVMLDNVQIPGHSGNTGAIAGTANGASRIYNCGVLGASSRIGGTGYTGSIVGQLNGTSRVINCFSYATINGGSTVAGIVGYNSNSPGTTTTTVTTGQVSRTTRSSDNANTTGTTTIRNPGTSSSTETTSDGSLILNSMFYGDITGGTQAYPIYGGSKISNNHTTTGQVINSSSTVTDTDNGQTGNIFNRTYYWDTTRTITTTSLSPVAINNYNYFRQEATLNNLQSDYNCALAAEERFLRRWEFYRGILNSNRELMAYYISGSTSDTALVAKWVQADGYLYPILKKWGRYPSQINSPYVLDYTKRPSTTYDYSINYDIDYANPEQETALNNKLATHFCGASLGTLTVNVDRGDHGSGTHAAITLPITDMDTHTLANRYDYCFRKVQLPYYNDLFSGNYGEYVVTGWDISNVVGNSTNTFVAADNATGYNYADTLDTGKDLVRTFAQGGYYYVPEGVTAITITAHWGKAVYVSDPNYDKTYSASYGSGYNFTAAGDRPTTFNSQTVHTSIAEAVAAVGAGNTVYDNAIVLLGNVHQHSGGSAPLYNSSYPDRPFTIMSIDRDKDNEPDYCLYYQHQDRQWVNPVRFDFLWQPAIYLAAKVDGDQKLPGIGIFYPRGHFEVTETAPGHYTEFEYEGYGDYDGNNRRKASSPLILNNGIFEQFVSTQKRAPSHTTNIILGGHIWMKEFCNGTHADGSSFTPHVPISVMGGEYNKFYLSGTFNPGATAQADNAECYVNGGKFGEIAGAGQEQIQGNVTFKINHAIIDEFYGGGINNAKPITGNIDVTINNSVVNKYCSGPKFGNMTDNMTVATSATGTVFGVYYGAGNGGTSLYRDRTRNNYNITSDATVSGYITDYTRGDYVSGRGVATGYEFEYFVWAGGNSANRVGRFYVHYASFDVAQTKNVTSVLDRCLVKTHFYGGGNLGAVDGSATSSLNSTIVLGDAYAAGFSAEIPTADVYELINSGETNGKFPKFDDNTGLFSAAVLPTPTKYTWSNLGSISAPLTDEGSNHYIYTDSDLNDLGKVLGNAHITVDGNSHIYGSLYGGGAMSEVVGHTFVNVQGNTKIDKNVYGGGNAGVVGGSTHVQVGGNEWTNQ